MMVGLLLQHVSIDCKVIKPSLECFGVCWSHLTGSGQQVQFDVRVG